MSTKTLTRSIVIRSQRGKVDIEFRCYHGMKEPVQSYTIHSENLCKETLSRLDEICNNAQSKGVYVFETWLLFQAIYWKEVPA